MVTRYTRSGFPLNVKQGRFFSLVICFRTDNGDYRDLTGYSGAGEIRKDPAAEVMGTFAVEVVPHPVTAQANAALQITLSAVDTAALVPGRAVYDIYIHPDDLSLREEVIAGEIDIAARVTA